MSRFTLGPSSYPTWSQNYIPSGDEWRYWWSIKADQAALDGFTDLVSDEAASREAADNLKANRAGDTFTGLVTLTKGLVVAADGATVVGGFTSDSMSVSGRASIDSMSVSGGASIGGNMDWGGKAEAGTAVQRFWTAGPPTEGAITPDTTLTASGGTPGAPNKGTLSISTGLFDLSASGQVLVPSIITFDGKEALNALTAEGRYVKSVPDASTTNKRITDIWENADGRTVTGNGTGSNVLASYADIPTRFTSASQIIQGNYVYAIPHNLGRIPFAMGAHLLCVTTEYNYPVGCITQFAIDDRATNGWSPSTVFADDTNLYFCGGGNDQWYGIPKNEPDGNADYENITWNNWRLIFWAT